MRDSRIPTDNSRENSARARALTSLGWGLPWHRCPRAYLILNVAEFHAGSFISDPV